jgi:hydrogenase maturation protease
MGESGGGAGEGRSYEGTTVVLCIGNRYMGDDGVGPEVSRRLRAERLAPGVVVRDSESADLGTVWEFRSARKLIMVDAVKAGNTPGTVTRHAVVPGGGAAEALEGLHGLDVAGAVGLASAGGARMRVVVVGVEPRDTEPGEGLSPEVEAAVPLAVAAVLAEL